MTGSAPNTRSDQAPMTRRHLVAVIEVLQRVADQLPDDGWRDEYELTEINRHGPLWKSRQAPDTGE